MFRSLQRLFSKVEVQLLPSKAALFLFGSSLVTIFMFINVFLVSIGLTAREAGLINGISFIGVTVIPPLLGFLSNSTNFERSIALVTYTISTGLIFSLPWVARSINLILPNNSTSSSKNDTLSIKANFVGRREFSSTLFFTMLLMVFVAKSLKLFLRDVILYLTTIAIRVTNSQGSVGNQLMLQPIGIGLAMPLAGLAIDNRSNDGLISHYVAAFYVFLPSMILLCPCLLILFKQSTRDEVTVCRDTNASIAEGIEDNKLHVSQKIKLFHTLRKSENLMILMSIFVSGLLRITNIIFLFLLMEDEMHSTKTAMGLAEGIGTLSQMFVFPVTKQIIEQLGGPVQSIEVSILGGCLLLGITSCIKTSWLAIIPQLLQVSSALMQTAMIQYATDISPPDLYLTMLIILTSIWIGVAGTIGSIFGGFLYYHYGGRLMFRYITYGGGTWFCLSLIYFHGKPLVQKVYKFKCGNMEYNKI